jgi:hypothetical protein
MQRIKRILASSLVVIVGLSGVNAFPASADATPPDTSTETGAQTAAKASGSPVEVTGLTTEKQQVYANSDGTFTATVAATPQRVHQAAGWVPVDTTLSAAANGTLVSKATTVALAFSGGGTVPLATIGSGGQADRVDLADCAS